MFCGLCSQVCPVDAITMSGEYELSVMDRDGLVYTKTELATIGYDEGTWWDTGLTRSDAEGRARALGTNRSGGEHLCTLRSSFMR